jgi:hypothetical protein
MNAFNILAENGLQVVSPLCISNIGWKLFV